MKAIPGGVDKVTHPNAKANKVMHKRLGSSAAPKDTSHGMDLSGDATNCVYKSIHPTKAESPNSKPHSRNQYGG
jgi:hypothetical protein